jgi:hypothetical protein
MAQKFSCWSVEEKAGSDPRPVHVEFMCKTVTHEQGSLHILRPFLNVSFHQSYVLIIILLLPIVYNINS